MLKSLLRVTVIGASVLALAGCGAQNGNGQMTQNGYRTNWSGAYWSSTGNGAINTYGTHQNNSLAQHRELARAIERLDGISKASVVMGDSNAYVAVQLSRNAVNSASLGGSNARSSASIQGYGQKGNYYGAYDSQIMPKWKGPNPSGWGRMSAPSETERTNEIRSGTGGVKADGSGMYRVHSGPAAMPENGGPDGNGSPGHSGVIGGLRTHGTAEGSMQGRTSSVTDLGDGGRQDSGSQYMYNGGAYGQWNEDLLSQQVRARVEGTVRSLMPDVRNVYISSDPAFMKRLNRIADNRNGGKSAGKSAAYSAKTERSLINEFNAYAQDKFQADGRQEPKYNMEDTYNSRNRNGVTEQMNNSFDSNNRRHRAGSR